MIFAPYGRGGYVGGDVKTAQPKNPPPDTAEAQTTVPLRGIAVAPGRALIGNVDELVASIRDVGWLLQPVVVNRAGRGRYTLVAGLARLEAARRLGWKRVPATVVDLDADAAELAELDENLARAELSAATRARLTWRRQRAYERLHPAARNGTIGATAKHRKRAVAEASASEIVSFAEPPRRDDPPAGVLPRGFAAELAAQIGRTPRSVQQDAQIGRELAEHLEVLERTPLADNKTELLKLARLKAARRDAVLGEIRKGGHAKVSYAEAALAKARRGRELRRRAKEAERQVAEGRAKLWDVTIGDCLEVLTGDKAVTAGVAPGGARMVFADPPYDLGKDYGRGRQDDRKGADAYADFTRQWVGLCARLLTPDGSLWAVVDHRCLLPVQAAMRDAGLHQRGVVSWPDPFAQYQPRNFTPGRFLVYAVKNPRNFVFHADAVAVPSKRQTRYADARAHPAGRTPSGCWDDIPTLCGTFAERGGGVTQLPVALVERPVLACTDAGDLVLDPFGGEGTAAVAAARHGRRCVLVERDAERAKRAAERLAAEGC